MKPSLAFRRFLLAGALLAAGNSAHAQSTWTGSAGDGAWGTTTNWSSTPSFTSTGGLNTSIIFPTFGSTLNTALGGTSGTDLSDGRTVGSITFNDSADDTVQIRLQASTGNTAARPLFIGGAATITITSGSLGAHTILGGGTLFMRNNLTVDHNGAGALTISSNIGENGGNYGITKNGAGTLTLSANTGNVYSGGTILNQGTITLSTTGRLGATTGALQVNNTNTGAGTAVQLTLATGQATTVGSLSGAIATPSGGTNTANITTASTRTFTVNQTAAGTYAGTISGAGNFALGASSNNTLTLSGTNTYTGATTVSAGTLLVNGSLGNSAVTLNGGAFGGSGTIGGTLNLVSGSFSAVDLLDALQVAGTVTLYAGFGVDDLAGLDWGSVLDGTYTLINGTLGAGVFDGLANNSLATAYDIDGISGGRSAYFQEGSLQLVVIPEPHAALIGGLGFLLLFRRRR